MKRVLLFFVVLSLMIALMPRAVWADPPEMNTEQVMVSEDAAAVQAVQPIDLQIIQVGDSVKVIVNGQTATFYLPQESKGGKALGWSGVVLALLISILAWYKSLKKQKFRSG